MFVGDSELTDAQLESIQDAVDGSTSVTGVADDHLAEVPLRLQVRVGGGRLGEGEDAVHHGAQAVQFDGAVHGVEALAAAH